MTMATQPALHDEPAAAPRAGHRDDANNEIRSIEHRVPPALPMTFVETAPFTAPHSARTDSTANTKPFRGDPPSGMGRTPFGTYTIDDAIEQEIASATNFDGAFLQKIRLYKNVSIDRISDASRVSRPYLTAIESNDYKSLPAAVFVRGFLVQIARTLGLDETKVAASYMKMFKAGGGK
jgi:hypothetical protein